MSGSQLASSLALSRLQISEPRFLICKMEVSDCTYLTELRGDINNSGTLRTSTYKTRGKHLAGGSERKFS